MYTCLESKFFLYLLESRCMAAASYMQFKADEICIMGQISPLTGALVSKCLLLVLHFKHLTGQIATLKRLTGFADSAVLQLGDIVTVIRSALQAQGKH